VCEREREREIEREREKGHGFAGREHETDCTYPFKAVFK
jgi:hypothetical protein